MEQNHLNTPETSQPVDWSGPAKGFNKIMYGAMGAAALMTIGTMQGSNTTNRAIQTTQSIKSSVDACSTELDLCTINAIDSDIPDTESPDVRLLQCADEVKRCLSKITESEKAE